MTTASGVPVLVRERAGADVTSVSVWVLAGSRDEADPGVAHLLEHVVMQAVPAGRGMRVVDEIERSIHDALSVVSDAVEDGRLVPGGGATAIEISKQLKEYATTVGGREQLAQAENDAPLVFAQDAHGLRDDDARQQQRGNHPRGQVHDSSENFFHVALLSFGCRTFTAFGLARRRPADAALSTSALPPPPLPPAFPPRWVRRSRRSRVRPR